MIFSTDHPRVTVEFKCEYCGRVSTLRNPSLMNVVLPFAIAVIAVIAYLVAYDVFLRATSWYCVSQRVRWNRTGQVFGGNGTFGQRSPAIVSLGSTPSGRTILPIAAVQEQRSGHSLHEQSIRTDVPRTEGRFGQTEPLGLSFRPRRRCKDLRRAVRGQSHR
jgi:hypothetical protein